MRVAESNSKVVKEFEVGKGKIEGGEGKTEGGERPIGQQKNEQRIIKEKNIFSTKYNKMHKRAQCDEEGIFISHQQRCFLRQ